jgi:hypothetical protein
MISGVVVVVQETNSCCKAMRILSIAHHKPKMEVAVREFLTSDGDPDFFFYTHFDNSFWGAEIKGTIGATDRWQRKLFVLVLKYFILCSVSKLASNFIIIL